MAAETVVDSMVDNKEGNYAGVKMKVRYRNGVVLDKKNNISKLLEKKEQKNGHESLSTKLNGFYKHINSPKPNTFADGIRAPSLRASPVRNKSMVVPKQDSGKTEKQNENRSVISMVMLSIHV